MDLQAFENALAQPNDVKLNPEWTTNVLTSLGVDAEDPVALAQFDEFLNYIVENHPDEDIDTTTFYNWWISFDPMGGDGGSGDLNTYQSIYDTFFPDDLEGFAPAYSDFIFRVFREGGDITPSEMISQWFDRNAIYFLSDPTFIEDSALSEGGYVQARIMIQIFRIVIDMIEDLQRLAKAQVERLDFFAAYQRAYTDFMEQVPQFLPAKTVNVLGVTLYVNDDFPEPFDTPVDPQNHPINADSIDAEQEQSLNKKDRKHLKGDREHRLDMSQLGAKYLENLRSLRSQVTSEAQTHQTRFGQTNEAVNQQTNIATDLLQQLQALVESVFNK